MLNISLKVVIRADIKSHEEADALDGKHEILYRECCQLIAGEKEESL